MNPQQVPSQTMSHLTPEIMQALMARRAQLGGGTAAPAQQQTMAPNSLGGPAGPSATPLQQSPMAVQSGSIPQSSPSSGAGQPAPGQDPNAQASPSGQGDSQNRVLMKALLSRLVAGL